MKHISPDNLNQKVQLLGDLGYAPAAKLML